MFYCQILKKASQPGEKQLKLVVKTRHRDYEETFFNEESRLYERVTVGMGYEIAQELSVTAEGLAEWELMSDKERQDCLKY